MKNIVVIKQGGSLLLNSRKPYRAVLKAEHRQSLLSEDVLDISVESKNAIDFNIGDKIEYQNRYFILNTAPKVKKEQGYYYYDLTFEGVQYRLRKKIYFNLDKTGFQTTSEFPLTGELDIFLKVLIDNINKVDDATWILGDYPTDVETKTLIFSNENCLAVLQKICQEYSTEFELQEDIVNNTIRLNIKEIGEVRDYVFEYGKGNGLYSLTRDNETPDVVTRLYIYGASDNIPSNYRGYSDKLRMPESVGDYLQDDEKVKRYGLKEDVKILDIKPSFKGIITKVGEFDTATNTQEIVVENMDFDLNEKDNKGNTKYLVAETPVKLHFNKGNLAGYEFELLKPTGYNHTTKTFKVRQFTDERGQKFPDIGTIFTFEKGDEFTLLDIVMPEKYIENAENRLLEQGRKEYEKASKNNLKYSLEIDPLFLEGKGNENTVFFGIGDYIRVKDEAMNADKTSRIINLTRDLLDPFSYRVDIADTYEISFTLSLLNEIKDTKKIVKTQTQINRQEQLNGFRNIEELKRSVFDTEGYFDPNHIKPNSIETNMLSVGAKNQRFVLENVTLNPNVNGKSSSLNITGGKLVHFSIGDQIREWTMLEFSQDNLLDITYYVYAKVEQSGVFGSWYVTTEKIKFDERAGYYHFLCYLLYTPKNGNREANAMYGNTLIHGGQVTTGKISSNNGKTHFDLDKGEIVGRIDFRDGITSGNMIVGNNYGANAGLTGLGGNADIFLWGGANYENKDTAPISFHRDGFMRVRNNDGNVIFEIGQENGDAVFNIYNDSGVKVASIGQRGIEFTGYIGESYKRHEMEKLTSSFNNESALIEEISKKMKKQAVERHSGMASINNNWIRYEVDIIKSITAYTYHSGRNFESANNTKYEGIYFVQENKLGNKLATGVYAKCTPISVMHGKESENPDAGFDDPGNVYNYDGNFILRVEVYELIDGSIRNSKSLNISGNVSRVRN